MKKLVFATQKGGAGKTTMALSTWSALGLDCLAIDVDTQGNFSSTTGDQGDLEYTIHDVLTGTTTMASAIRHTARRYTLS